MKIALDPVGTCGRIDHVVLRLLIVVAIAFASRDAGAQVFRPRGKLNVKPTPITAKAAAPAAPAAPPKATPTAEPAVDKKPRKAVAKKKKRRKSDDVVIEDEDDDVQIKDDE